MVVIEKKDGIVRYNFDEVTAFIEEQIKLVPGIVGLGKTGMFGFIRNKLGLRTNAVQIHQFSQGKIMIDLELVIDSKVNYVEVEKEINTILRYTLKKKYGIEVSAIDIYVQDLV